MIVYLLFAFIFLNFTFRFNYKSLLGILLLSIISISFVVQQQYSYEFAIRVTPSPSSTITTAIVTVQNNKIVRTEMVSEQQFVLEVSGIIKSKANPAPADLFTKNRIFACSQTRDTISWRYRDTGQYNYPNVKPNPKYKYDYITQVEKGTCPVLKDLWRIRYKYDVTKKAYNGKYGGKAEGWAGDNYFPSLAQVNFLKANYGADGINEYIYGEKLFQLLRDIQDTVWINKYKDLR